MNDLQLLAKRTWSACAVMILLLLVWQWYWLGVNDAGSQSRPDELVTPSQFDTQEALGRILAHNLWEPTRKSVEASTSQTDSGAAVAQQAISWQLVAIARSGDNLTAFMGNPADPASYKKYSEGDVLPSGGKILKILSDRLVYQANQKPNEGQSNSSADAVSKKELYLFGRKGE